MDQAHVGRDVTADQRGYPILRGVRHRVRRFLELRVGRPRLAHLLDEDTPSHQDARSFVADLTNQRESGTSLDAELAELENVWVRKAMLLAGSSFPLRWDVGDETSRALYLLVRMMWPDHVLETGVANGRSTWWVLQALHRNGHGQLHSFDISEDVGHYLSKEDRVDWTLGWCDPGAWEAGRKR